MGVAAILRIDFFFIFYLFYSVSVLSYLVLAGG